MLFAIGIRFDNYEIDRESEEFLRVNTEIYYRGDTDYKSVLVPIAAFDDIQILIDYIKTEEEKREQKRKEHERLSKENEDKRMRALYLSLKERYENE